MLGYIKENTKELCGSMPLHYPADRVYRHGNILDDIDSAIDDIKISIKTVTFTTNSVGAFEVSNDVTEFCLGLMFSVGDEYTYYQYNNRSFILFDMAGNKKLNTTVTARAIITHI